MEKTHFLEISGGDREKKKGREKEEVLGVLEEAMEQSGRSRKWKILKHRLRLKGIACCSSSWGFGPPAQIPVIEDTEEEEEEEASAAAGTEEGNRAEECADGSSQATTTGMNLAMALAVERNYRAAQEMEGVESTPERVSLMRRMVEEEEEAEEGGGGGDGDGGGVGLRCIVCMVRKKGAAFIPCGHTFCRVCSRELWLNRGCCPLCNRSILEILDIY
ncbi:hypothetical protein ACLOJK_035815 [Asimina triloba]